MSGDFRIPAGIVSLSLWMEISWIDGSIIPEDGEEEEVVTATGLHPHSWMQSMQKWQVFRNYGIVPAPPPLAPIVVPFRKVSTTNGVFCCCCDVTWHTTWPHVTYHVTGPAHFLLDIDYVSSSHHPPPTTHRRPLLPKNPEFFKHSKFNWFKVNSISLTASIP